MQWLIIARDGTDAQAPERRMAARSAHLENAARLGESSVSELGYAYDSNRPERSTPPRRRPPACSPGGLPSYMVEVRAAFAAGGLLSLLREGGVVREHSPGTREAVACILAPAHRSQPIDREA